LASNHARIDSKSFALDQTGGHAGSDDAFEYPAKDIEKSCFSPQLSLILLTPPTLAEWLFCATGLLQASIANF
jgi:hypothetical protein